MSRYLYQIQTNRILTMTWNKKNQQFALSCGLRPSSKEFMQWVLRRAKPGQVSEIEIDLRVFNKFIERDRGRGYDRKTLKEVLAQVDEKTHGLILITKSYTWAIHKIIIRPLEIILQEKSSTEGKTPKVSTVESMFNADHKNRVKELLLQNISKLDSLFKKLGMNYTPDALIRIWRMAGKSMTNIKQAVEYMLCTHADKIERSPESIGEIQGITTPKGWLHNCLKYGWHQVQDEVTLPYLEGEYIYSFVDSLMGVSPP